MKYVVQASSVTELYEVQKFKNDDGKTFCQKPEFVKKRFDDWKEELSFECDQLEYNIKQEKLCVGVFAWDIMPNRIGKINLSETEEVAIIERIFRADKATTYLHSDKVLSITEDKTTNWQAYQDALVEYRNYVFEKYPAVKEYCELHCVKDEFENIDKIKDIVLKDRQSIGVSSSKIGLMEISKESIFWRLHTNCKSTL